MYLEDEVDTGKQGGGTLAQAIFNIMGKTMDKKKRSIPTETEAEAEAAFPETVDPNGFS